MGADRGRDPQPARRRWRLPGRHRPGCGAVTGDAQGNWCRSKDKGICSRRPGLPPSRDLGSLPPPPGWACLWGGRARLGLGAVTEAVSPTSCHQRNWAFTKNLGTVYILFSLSHLLCHVLNRDRTVTSPRSCHHVCGWQSALNKQHWLSEHLVRLEFLLPRHAGVQRPK